MPNLPINEDNEQTSFKQKQPRAYLVGTGLLPTEAYSPPVSFGHDEDDEGVCWYRMALWMSFNSDIMEEKIPAYEEKKAARICALEPDTDDFDTMKYNNYMTIENLVTAFKNSDDYGEISAKKSKTTEEVLEQLSMTDSMVMFGWRQVGDREFHFDPEIRRRRVSDFKKEFGPSMYALKNDGSEHRLDSTEVSAISSVLQWIKLASFEYRFALLLNGVKTQLRLVVEVAPIFLF
jgi:hypothetical protein